MARNSFDATRRALQAARRSAEAASRFCQDIGRILSHQVDVPPGRVTDLPLVECTTEPPEPHCTCVNLHAGHAPDCPWKLWKATQQSAGGGRDRAAAG